MKSGIACRLEGIDCNKRQIEMLEESAKPKARRAEDCRIQQPAPSHPHPCGTF